MKNFKLTPLIILIVFLLFGCQQSIENDLKPENLEINKVDRWVKNSILNIENQSDIDRDIIEMIYVDNFSKTFEIPVDIQELKAYETKLKSSSSRLNESLDFDKFLESVDNEVLRNYFSIIRSSSFDSDKLLSVDEDILQDDALDQNSKLLLHTFLTVVIELEKHHVGSNPSSPSNGRIECDRTGQREDCDKECADEREASMEDAFVGSLIGIGGVILSGPGFAVGGAFWAIGTTYAILSVENTYDNCLFDCEVKYPCI